MPNPSNMSADEIVREIHRLRDEVGDRAVRLAVLSQVLYQSARRKGLRQEYEQASTAVYALEDRLRLASDEEKDELRAKLAQLRTDQQTQQQRVGAYTAVANSWQRFAGMITQGIRRNQSVDRLVEKYKQDQEDRAPVKTAAPRAAQAPAPETGLEDLVDLYDLEAETHARR